VGRRNSRRFVAVSAIDWSASNVYPNVAVTVTAGYAHTCALFLGVGQPNYVMCWGDNTHGQLGIGGTSDKPASGAGVCCFCSGGCSPTFSSLASGWAHSCAVMATPYNQVYCWGDNQNGQIGLDPSSSPIQTTAFAVPLVMEAAEVTAGAQHTCVLHKSGAVSCWGANGNGQLGDGTTTNRWTSDVVKFF
jgi:alpha-tubulin suppressor-like RCC1 family protein